MGYGRLEPRVEAFLGSIGSPNFPHTRSLSRLRHVQHGFANAEPSDTWTWTTIATRRLPSCVTPVNTLTYYRSGSHDPPPTQARTASWCSASSGPVWAVLRRYGNINPLSIDYACRPRLRSRLTQGGLTWPWNPWSFGGRVSHPSFATHACILTRVASTTGLPRRFTRHTTLPYPSTHLDHHEGDQINM